MGWLLFRWWESMAAMAMLLGKWFAYCQIGGMKWNQTSYLFSSQIYTWQWKVQPLSGHKQVLKISEWKYRRNVGSWWLGWVTVAPWILYGCFGLLICQYLMLIYKCQKYQVLCSLQINMSLSRINNIKNKPKLVIHPISIKKLYPTVFQALH